MAQEKISTSASPRLNFQPILSDYRDFNLIEEQVAKERGLNTKIDHREGFRVLIDSYKKHNNHHNGETPPPEPPETPPARKRKR